VAKKKATKKTRSSRSSRSAPDPKKRPEYVPGYDWNEDAAKAPVDFIQACCRHPNEHGGDPTRITLIDWQKDEVLRPLFGWRRPDGRLRYRRAGIFVPKKNRKSSLMSQLAQYIITCHAPAQDCFLAANDRLQARTMYRMIRQSVEASPKLSKMLEVVDSRSIIRNRATGKEIRCLSSDSWRNEGLNGSVILDEIHSFRTPDLVNALTYATRGTANGIVISISTAGDNRNGIGYQWWKDCELVMKDPATNPTFYGLIYAADPTTDDFADPKVWRKANPSMGIAFPEDEFAADYQDATTDPRKMSKFLRYSLNVWQEADARWFQGDAWAQCHAGPAEPLAGRPCWVGVDLASNLDMTAAAFVFKERDGSYAVEWRYWVPRETVADRVRDGIPYDTWIREGWVTVTDGHRLDHESVARDIIAYGEAHEIKAVGVDPWQAGALETLLQREGITVKDIPQRTAYLNSSCKLLEALVVEKRLRTGGNPVATWNANNVCVYTDPTGMIKPDKAKSNEKIDGVAALVNALALASTDEDDVAGSLDDYRITLI
jgi:phage terminase large subunit-like protein